ncbi:MAG: peptide deformylase, partial [Coxiellaceae bacterium]|nr:peptide deformylase [Coxiellaceae bacterium]
MAMVEILQYPDKRLGNKGKTVTDFGPETQKIIDDMYETLYNTENCAALAMTQLDFADPLRITVIDFSPKKDQPLCLVNPEITPLTSEPFDQDEGCMSVPGGI